jgi:hypothetical protein
MDGNSDGNYGDNQECRASMLLDAALNAVEFDTESCCDTLTIGGTVFGGTDGPSNFVVSEGDEILWSSDFSVNAGGWKVCGAPPPTPLPTPSPTASPTVSPTPSPTFSDMYELGTPTAGAVGAIYKVCWAHSPTHMSDFRVTLDAAAVLNGPTPGDIFECTLGLPCQVQVSGYGLEASNAIVAISDGTCGTDSMVLASWQGESGRTPVAADDSLLKEFGFGTALVGTSGSFYKLCWSHEPSSLLSYNVAIDLSADLFARKW